MDTAKDLANKAIQSIDQFVDTVKVKAHLASMDLSDIWDDFESQITKIRFHFKHIIDEVKHDSDEARLQAHLALMEAKMRWDSISDDIDHTLNSALGKVEQKVDHGKVKLSLAKLEAEHLIDVDEQKARFHSLGDKAKEEWYSFLTKFNEKITDFINRFPLQ